MLHVMLRTTNTQSTATVGSELIASSTGNVQQKQITLNEAQSEALIKFFNIADASAHSAKLLDLFQDYLGASLDDGISNLDPTEISDCFFTINSLVNLLKAIELPKSVIFSHAV